MLDYKYENAQYYEWITSVADYVQKNSIDIVLNKKDILMGKNNYNITEEILKMVNNTN